MAMALACTACGQADEPAADPVAVEQLLVRLDSQQAAPIQRQLPAKTNAKLNQAERLVAPLEKIGPEKIDPQVALAVIGG